jgi:quercetin dioxygenase-like cupin family protein
MTDAAPGTPRVQALKDLVTYQAGSVVSRQLVKNPAGNVTLFAFAAGEGLSEHTAPFDALVVVTDGRADITIGAAAYAVQAGESLLLPANAPHAIRANERFQMLLVMIRA